MKIKNYKREYRELSDETKARISAKMKGKGKSQTHRENISKGMKAYWLTVPHCEVENLKNKKSNPQPDVTM